ncbi:MAG TPA: RlmE family RNA methyltransferase [Gammaproteobacteria bacterium]|nr:RlmE family RNA methyltransferase [Gammaproteobacteria bacterium]
MGRSSKSNYRDGDTFSRKAKLEGYRSRSAFKLKELQNKDRLIKRGMSILDLGSFPGGWSQVSKEIVGEKGKIVGIDLQEMKPIQGTSFIHKSVIELKAEDFDANLIPFDIVLSDMAPNISGIQDRDNAQMIDLLDKVIYSIENFLKTGGSTIIKVFQGESLEYAKRFVKEHFLEVKIRKPDSSRRNSSETYILGINLKEK